MTRTIALITLLAAAGCGSTQEQDAPAAEEAARPAEEIRDETHRFHKEGLVEAKVVETGLGGKDFMPGGNFAEYEADGSRYQVFFTKRRNADQALFLSMDYKELLADAKFVAHFGGFFGMDGETPTLIFQKNEYFIVVTGLDLEAADQAGRMIAGYLN